MWTPFHLLGTSQETVLSFNLHPATLLPLIRQVKKEIRLVSWLSLQAEQTPLGWLYIMCSNSLTIFNLAFAVIPTTSPVHRCCCSASYGWAPGPLLTLLQVQSFAPLLLQLYEVSVGLILKFSKVFLDWNFAIWCAIHYHNLAGC